MSGEGSSEDEAWLQDLCSAPRRSLHVTPSNSSDDAWLHELCRGTRPPEHQKGRSGPSQLQHESSRVPVMVQPKSSGVSVMVQPTDASPGRQSEQSADGTPQSPRRCSGFQLVEPVSKPSYDFMSQLANELVQEQMPLPSPKWPLPMQDAIIWEAVRGDGHIGRSAVCSGVPVLRRCMWRIAAWSESLNICIFKIGIAFCPEHRWRNPEFGYVTEETWMFMDVMHMGSAEECRTLEIDLIARLRKIPGCYNHKPGGEGISAHSAASTSCYCYAVYAPAGSGASVHKAWLSRMRQLALD